MKQFSSNTESGFTLVELIVVIVVLGILAATALPKFINVTEDANMAAANGMAGGLRSATALTQARFFASGTGTSPVTMADGSPVAVGTAGTASGVPTAAAAGIEAAMQSTQGFTVSHTAGVSTFALVNTPACLVTFTAATGVVSTAAVTAANC